MVEFSHSKYKVIANFSTEPQSAIEAIEASIAKWEYVLSMLKGGILVHDGGPGTCALCFMYNNDSCVGCPIRLYTGEKWCHDTPYWDYTKAQEENCLSDAFIAAEDEIAFLKKLLEETKNENNQG